MRWARQKPFLAAIYGCSLLMYMFHLISMRFLRDPYDFKVDLYATCLIVSLVVGSTGIQRMLEVERLRATGEYLFQLIVGVALTIGLMLDHGPTSAPIADFFVSIAAAAVLGYRPALVWFTTVLSMLCYVWLLVYAQWFEPANAATGEQAVCMLFALLSMGITIHLTLRRGSAIVLQGKLSGSRSGLGRSG